MDTFLLCIIISVLLIYTIYTIVWYLYLKNIDEKFDLKYIRVFYSDKFIEWKKKETPKALKLRILITTIRYVIFLLYFMFIISFFL